MRSRRLLLASAILCVTSATPVVYKGTFSNFVAQPARSTTAVVSDLYNECSETDDAGQILSTGSVCVARLVSCMLEALGTVADGSFSVAAVNSTVNTITTHTSRSEGTSHKREEASNNHTLQTFPHRLQNDAFAWTNVRVTDVIPSRVHPNDGVALRMNVHGDDSTLHVHTNGTHAMARFESLGSVPARKRDILDPQGSHFKFTAVKGLKMEAQGIQTDGDQSYMPDMTAFAYGFAYGNGQTPIFQQGDSWTYEVCQKVVSTPSFYGRLIAELDGFGTNYESVSPLGCS